ncbi:MAG: glycosyltransferase family 4 protein [Bacteroidota bacterium]
MKIALAQFYSNTPTPVYKELSAALRAIGHTVLVGTPDAQGDLVWNEGESVVAKTAGPRRSHTLFFRLPLIGQVIRRVRHLAFLGRVKLFLRKFDPDVVQLNKTMFSGYIPIFMPREILFVYDIRQLGLWGDKSTKGRIANGRVLQRMRFNARYMFDKACFASEIAARKVLGNNWSKYGAITPIGVDKNFITFEFPQVQSSTGHCRFVYVGTIGKMRNLELLLDAASIVMRQNNRFTLTLIGPGDEREYYNNMIQHLGLQQCVSIVDPVPYREIPKVITAHDVAVAYVPDIEDWQCQPTLKILEYRALGMPVLASDNPPNREAVENEINGILVVNTPQSLASGMLRFINEPELLQRTQSNARAMRSGRTWEDVARIHINEVYRHSSRWKSQLTE